MLTNDATLLLWTFSETIDYFGVQKTIELVPGGATKDVDDTNKEEYILKVSFYKLYEGVKD